MKSWLIIAFCVLVLSGCRGSLINSRRNVNTQTRTQLEQKMAQDEVVSTGNIDQDLEAIESDLYELDSATDFDPFSETELTQ